MEYLVKSIVCLMVLLTIHRLLLQKEVFYQFNRFYLLGAVVFSFLIPLNTLETVVLVENQESIFEKSDAPFENFIQPSENFAIQEFSSVQPVSKFPWFTLISMVYGLVCLAFFIRFVNNIRILHYQIQNNLKVTYRGHTLVLLPGKVVPYTFFKYIFVNRDEFVKKKLSDAVLDHELAHVEEKHSWDIFFIELLLIPFWFHPGLYWAKQSIQLNHEFIADQKALKLCPIDQYQQELLSLAFSNSGNTLVSNLNFSLTKKRLEMMKKQTKPTIQAIKILVLLPVLGLVIYGFSEKKTVAEMKAPNGKTTKASMAENEPLFVIHGNSTFEFEEMIHPIDDFAKVLGKENNPKGIHIIVDRGTPQVDIKKVESIMKDLDIKKISYVEVVNSNQQKEEEQKNIPKVQGPANSDEEYYRNTYFLIEDSQMNYTHKTYAELTEKQKGRLMRPKFDGVKAKSPSPELFEKFKKKEDYAIWIDGKVMPNSELEKYSSGDFYHYFDSYVYPNARSERFPQEHQVSLHSGDYYLEVYGPNAEMFKSLTSNDTITLTERNVTWHKNIQKYPDPTTKYLQVFTKYEKLRHDGVQYDSKSNQEKEELDEMYQQLKEKYFSSRPNWQQRVKKPIPPRGNSEA